MLTLFRGGPVGLDRSRATPSGSGSADNDWVEVVNRNGVIACRAVVSHRIPDGSALHVPLAGSPRERADQRDQPAPVAAPTTPSRGSSIKPTHLIGGYAQLSYGFNYYGAIGSQRDELDDHPEAAARR